MLQLVLYSGPGLSCGVSFALRLDGIQWPCCCQGVGMNSESFTMSMTLRSDRLGRITCFHVVHIYTHRGFCCALKIRDGKVSSVHTHTHARRHDVLVARIINIERLHRPRREFYVIYIFPSRLTRARGSPSPPASYTINNSLEFSSSTTSTLLFCSPRKSIFI